MSDALFAYGTLLAPDVMESVAGRRLPGVEGVLHGWARYALRGRVYPALVPEAGARTPGRIFSGIDALTWQRLDRFEGPLYERRTVTVERGGAGRVVAEVYVLRASQRSLLSREPWDLERFVEHHLATDL